MTYEHRESLATSEDPHSLLFGEDDWYDSGDPDGLLDADPAVPAPSAPHDQLGPPGRRSGSHRHRTPRRRRGARTALVTAAVVVVVIAVLAWLVVVPAIRNSLATQDYSGSGTGSVSVQVHQGDAASQIGTTLHQAGVVKSVSAFTKAAQADPASQGIQPGTYRLHSHMSGQAALALMLTPSARTIRQLTVPEGRTVASVEQALAQSLGVPQSQVSGAVQDVAALGIPSTYDLSGGAVPSSVEGFLYPDTYTFDPSESPSDALQDMVSEYAAQDRSIGFANQAAKLGISPYDALIIASMIEGEAKFPQDRAKVARVIYNRLKAHTPLGIDATSVYGAELNGKPASSVTFTENSPYNTRNRTGLPPTPIGNPGQASLLAAVQPASGDWIYYVNGDAQGHLAFFDNAADFEKAKRTCAANGWGCS